MSILDTFFIMFEGDTSNLDKGIHESDDKAKKFGESLGGIDETIAGMGESFMSLAEKAGGLIGVGFSIKEIWDGVSETAKDYKSLELLGAQFRTTADAVDEFRDAGELLGLSNEETIGGLKGLDSAIQDTAMGMGRAKKVFEGLGISVKDAAGNVKPTTEVMAELQEKMKGMDRGKQIRVMEKLGLDPSLLKLFNADMDNLKGRMEQIDKATGFNFDEAERKSAIFTKSSKSMWLEIKTLGMYFDKLKEVMFIGLMDEFSAGMDAVGSTLHSVFDFLIDHQDVAKGALMIIGGAIAYFLVPAAISGAIAIWAMIAPFVAIGALVLGVAAFFGLLYDDMMTFDRGGKSMIGDLAAKFPIIGDAVHAIIDVLRLLKTFVGAVFTFFVEAIHSPEKAWSNFVKTMSGGLGALKGHFPSFFAVIDSLYQKFEKLMALAGKVIGAVGKIASFAGDVVGGGMDIVHNAVAAGKNALGTAAGYPLNNVSNTAIANKSSMNRSGSVNVGTIQIQTQATNSEDIAKHVGEHLQTHIKRANAQFDDGVIA